MPRQEAMEQYQKALKLGQKQVRERQARGLDPNPAVLSRLLPEGAVDTSQTVGLMEIPMERIVGTTTAGRITAFSAGFMPLLDLKTEFATKWIDLCIAHLTEGIRDPVVCYEYLGNFYVQEGNKRVSVLRSFDSPRIAAMVHRIPAPAGDEPKLKAYQKFLEFFKYARVYNVQFTQPGGYAKLTKAMGLAPGTEWTEADRRRFRAYFQYFQEAYQAVSKEHPGTSADDALLLWLELYPYEKLGSMTGAELKKSLSDLWGNVKAMAQPQPEVRTQPPVETKPKNSILKIIRPDHVDVAFVHQRTAASSPWTNAHELGRKHLETVLGKAVTTRSYQNANTPEEAEALLEQAVADGADVIFTTTPQLVVPSLKLSVKYPKVKVFNCSVDMPYSTVRSYYSRIYEGKFITGAMAGAMAKNDRIGYVGDYPIHGIPASINAFALGAQLTNPRAVIELKWSCLPGNPTKEFLQSGIRVVSNQDTPVEDRLFTEYGTYIYTDDDKMQPLASPIWLWGNFYEQVVVSILSGSWNSDPAKAVNDWWGMSSGVVDVKLADALPDGVRHMAQILRKGLKSGAIEPFQRRIVAQDGAVKNDGTRAMTPDELLHMDWLCNNVVGSFPKMEEILPVSRPMVQLLGIFPEEKESAV